MASSRRWNAAAAAPTASPSEMPTTSPRVITPRLFNPRLIKPLLERCLQYEFLNENYSAFKVMNRKRSQLTLTFRNYRDHDMTASTAEYGRELLAAISVKDVSSDLDFACLVLNASVLFEAPLKPELRDHFVGLLADRGASSLSSGGGDPTELSVQHFESLFIGLMCQADMLLQHAVAAIAKDADGGGAASGRTAQVESNDADAAPEDPFAVGEEKAAGQEGSGGSSSVVKVSAQEQAERRRAAIARAQDDAKRFQRVLLVRMLPAVDALVGDLPKDITVRVLIEYTKAFEHCIAVASQSSTDAGDVIADKDFGALLLALMERLDMLKTTLTHHELSQSLFCFALLAPSLHPVEGLVAPSAAAVAAATAAGTTVGPVPGQVNRFAPFKLNDMMETAQSWMDQCALTVDFALCSDLAASLYACSTLGIQSQPFLETCCTRIYSSVWELDAEGVAQVATAIAITGLKAPKLSKALGEVLKQCDMTDVTPLMALDVAVALAIIGAGDDAVFSMLTAKMMSDSKVILSQAQARKKLLSLTAVLAERESGAIQHTPLWMQLRQKYVQEAVVAPAPALASS